ncbi:uncharacterized protein BJ212DRAFT_1304474 [Suillus subaureus]|uniref:Uncharacterized protein n=1 Tax=Suillus subaureus TaxID=48587 RepID=A0A9P7J5R7_9AGAM|nr:uncharacterized protein BJ212DRAFT_1304474 [Suillus subaureus]KAG1803951.1 hypothetical protein BJ212DRAFT_1304474 [Suillus subaureus]
MWALSALMFTLEIEYRKMFATTTIRMEAQKNWARVGDFLKPPKMTVLNCLAFTRLADFHHALSWACVVSCGLGPLLGVNSANCWMYLMWAYTLALILGAFFKRNVRAMIRRS